MDDMAAEAVAKTAVGQFGSMKPTLNTVESLEAFQAVALEADRLHREGVISIRNMHRESQTGKAYIDLIAFIRLR